MRELFRVKALEPIRAKYVERDDQGTITYKQQINMEKDDIMSIPTRKAHEFIERGWAEDARIGIAEEDRIPTGERKVGVVKIKPNDISSTTN